MKKILGTILLFMGLFSFGNNYLQTLNDFEQEIRYKKHTDLYCIDYMYADFFLINTKLDRQFADEVIIILPDVRLLEQNKEKISNLGKDVIVFLLDKKSEKLKNRSIKELKKRKLAKNIRIIEVNVKTEDEKKLIDGLNDNSIYYTEYFRKVFYEKYKKITKYDYMGVLQNEK